MPIDTQHKQYVEFLPDWIQVRDANSGQRKIKSKETLYLPMPSGFEQDYENNNTTPYDNYLARAAFPEWVASSVRAMIGLAFESPPILEVPPILESIRERATELGEPLETLTKRAVKEVLLTARYGLLADISNALPYISSYIAESIINWKIREVQSDNLAKLDFVVLQESYIVDDSDKFNPSSDTEYRELFINEQGSYEVNVWRKAGNAGQFLVDDERTAIPTTTRGVALDTIPFVIAGSSDLHPDCDQIPLLQMALSAIKYYQLSADYYQSLFMTANPTPVISGGDSETIDRIGTTALWSLPMGASASFLEISGTGIASIRQAMQDTHQAALEAGAKVRDAENVESGVARRSRQKDQQATLRSVMINVCAAIEQTLRHHAVILNADPDSVSYTPILDFSDQDVDAAILSALNQSVVAGNAPRSVLWEALRESGLTEKDDELIASEIEDDKAAGLPDSLILDDEDEDDNG